MDNFSTAAFCLEKCLRVYLSVSLFQFFQAYIVISTFLLYTQKCGSVIVITSLGLMVWT